MTQDQLAARVRRVLKDIAPEADVERLDPRYSFRDQLDMDSIDYLNFILALEADVGVRIPDADYPKLSTLGGCIDYLKRSKPSLDRAPALAAG